jgi:transcriptional regulator with XRE-family HTH domain
MAQGMMPSMRQPTATRIDFARAKEAREAAGLSLETAARRAAGVLPEGRQFSMSTLQRIEAGRIASPEPYVVAALAEVYDVDVSDIAPDMVSELGELASLLDRQAKRCAGSAIRAVTRSATSRNRHPKGRAWALASAARISGLPMASGE